MVVGALGIARALALPVSAVAQSGDGEPVTLTMGSFRTHDIDAWNAIIPLFEAEHPDIKVVFDPTNNVSHTFSAICVGSTTIIVDPSSPRRAVAAPTSRAGTPDIPWKMLD